MTPKDGAGRTTAASQRSGTSRGVVTRQQLVNVDLFSEFGDERLDALAEDARLMTLGRGDVLFSEHDEPDALYVTLSGRIAMVNRSVDGRESVVALMEDGDLFGEMPLFDQRNRSTDARALEPSEVIYIPYEPLRHIYSQDPAQLWRVVKLLAERIRTTDGVLADSVFLDVTGRTAKRLLEIAGSDDEFSLPVTQEELAGMVGASRERVNKAIASFIRLGWLEQRDRRYAILDRHQMEIRAS